MNVNGKAYATLKVTNLQVDSFQFKRLGTPSDQITNLLHAVTSPYILPVPPLKQLFHSLLTHLSVFLLFRKSIALLVEVYFLVKQKSTSIGNSHNFLSKHCLRCRSVNTNYRLVKSNFGAHFLSVTLKITITVVNVYALTLIFVLSIGKGRLQLLRHKSLVELRIKASYRFFRLQTVICVEDVFFRVAFHIFPGLYSNN